MLSTSYRVEIAQITGSGDAAGFVDPTRVENYIAAGATAGTYAQHTDKERGNYRYKAILQAVQAMGNLYVSDIELTGGSPAAAPTKVAFTLTAERGDGMLITADENNAGQELTGAAAIERCIARALIQGRQNLMCDIFDSTTTTAPKNGATSTTAVRTGPRVTTINIAALANNLTTAEAAITVTKL